jgi:hypothetical protein
MNNIWEFVDDINKRSLAVKAFIMCATFFAGIILNATYGLVDWVRLPYNNQRDIIILLEKSQEITNLNDSMSELRNALEDNNSDTLDLVGRVSKLEDGQLRLFLKVERIDERTINQNR